MQRHKTQEDYSKALQDVYTYDIKESLKLILLSSTLHVSQIASVLDSLDDAVSNNWDELMETFCKAL